MFVGPNNRNNNTKQVKNDEVEGTTEAKKGFRMMKALGRRSIEWSLSASDHQRSQEACEKP